MGDSKEENKFLVTEGKLFDLIGINDLVINEMNQEWLQVKIKGPDDKAGYAKVKEGLRLYVKLRTGATAYAEKGRAAAILYQKENIKEQKRILALAAIGEDYLVGEKKIVDDAEEAIKQEKIRQEEARIQTRIDRLEEMGMGLVAGHYQLSFDAPGVAVPVALLRVCTDEQFEQFLVPIQGAKTRENSRLLEIENKWIAEQERVAQVAAAQESERKKLEAEEARLAEEARKAIIRVKLEEADRQKAEDALRAERDSTRREQEEWAAIKQAELDDEKRKLELEKVRQESALKAVKDMEEKTKREAEEKRLLEEKIKEVAAKKEARRPDKERIIAFTGSDFFIPTCKTPEGLAIIAEFRAAFNVAMLELKRKAVAL